MGRNTPEPGERVIYYTTSGPIFATVIAVVFWDLVDLRLADGVVLRGVWRVLAMNVGEDDVGKFERLVPRLTR